MEHETIKLGGREYKRVGISTLEHDHYLAGHARQAGSEQWTLRSGESHEAFAARILSDLMASGKAFPLLGGLLMPADRKAPWTVGIAGETARHMAGLTDPEEKRIANTELLSLVLDFFVNGLAYWMTSGKSSPEEVSGSATDPAAASGSGGQSSAS